MQVSLEEIYNGAVRKLALQKSVICEKCEGRGGKKGAVESCGTCQGKGVEIKIQQIMPGFVQKVMIILIQFLLFSVKIYVYNVIYISFIFFKKIARTNLSLMSGTRGSYQRKRPMQKLQWQKNSSRS